MIFATPSAETAFPSVIAAHNPAQDCEGALMVNVGQGLRAARTQWLADLARCEGDPCFFCGMGELAAQRMEGPIA
jgi:hypothetical protein